MQFTVAEKIQDNLSLFFSHSQMSKSVADGSGGDDRNTSLFVPSEIHGLLRLLPFDSQHTRRLHLRPGVAQLIGRLCTHCVLQGINVIDVFLIISALLLFWSIPSPKLSSLFT